jgi:hypothetical protein
MITWHFGKMQMNNQIKASAHLQRNSNYKLAKPIVPINKARKDDNKAHKSC